MEFKEVLLERMNSLNSAIVSFKKISAELTVLKYNPENPEINIKSQEFKTMLLAIIDDIGVLWKDTFVLDKLA